MNCSQIKTGDRFGRLVVLEEVEPIYGKQKIRRYLCQCDCGNTKIVGIAPAVHTMQNIIRIGGIEKQIEL